MIYLDNAATTQIYESVNQLVFDINSKQFFNSSALYDFGVESKKMFDDAKNQLANNLVTSGEHIIFTSGATESNNMAIFGFLTGKKDAEYIFSSGEHPSVNNVAEQLKLQGKIVKFLPIQQDGTISSDSLKKTLNENTHFVSIMHVSNETGAINDVEKLCKVVKEYNPNIIFHCDGTQAFGKIPVDVEKLGVDCYTISAHKFHGPKGVGALYVKSISKLKPTIFGGGQQNGKRSGTENLSGVCGMALAGSIACKNIQTNYAMIKSFRDYVKQEISANFDDFIFNECDNNSPYILSISFKDLRGEVLLHMLDKCGVIIGVGSACSSKKQENRVLSQMKVKKEYLLGSIRISFSSFNTPEEIKTATEKIVEQVKLLKEKMKK